MVVFSLKCENDGGLISKLRISIIDNINVFTMRIMGVTMLKQGVLSWINNNNELINSICAILSITGAAFSFFYFKKVKKYSLLLTETNLCKEIKEKIILNSVLKDLDYFNVEDVKKNIGLKLDSKIIYTALFELYNERKLTSENLQNIKDVKKAKFSFYRIPFVGHVSEIKRD